MFATPVGQPKSCRCLIRHGFGNTIDQLGLRRALPWARRLLLRKPVEPPIDTSFARRVRLVLEDLGPTFIKFGQVLSTRPDLFPESILLELSRLQEHVPPFSRPNKQLRFWPISSGNRRDQLFKEFDLEPIAAGSLGQVHAATLRDDTKVAIKVRRPNAVRDVERDLSLMLDLARVAERRAELAVFDPVGLVNYFSRSIRRELNFQREGRTIDQFRRMFHDDATLYVPRVFDEFTTESVLTMEFIDGFRVDDLEAATRLGLDPKELACNGARIFLKQAFELGVFHGDPHPGNVRILPDGTVALIDFGMIGQLSEETRERLVDLLFAVSRKDVRTVVAIVR